jgi:hypothetical protein
MHMQRRREATRDTKNGSPHIVPPNIQGRYWVTWLRVYLDFLCSFGFLDLQCDYSIRRICCYSLGTTGKLAVSSFWT